MTLIGTQRFSASSFSGLGSRRAASSSSGLGAGGLGSIGFGKGFGVAGGGGGFGVTSIHMSSRGSGMGFGGGVGAGAQFGFGGSRSGGSALRTGAGAGGSAGMGGDVVGNEKMHMRFLNDRLAAYMEQVRMLEATNRELEEKLRSITFNKVVPNDLTKFDAQIKPLREQLLAVILQHARISLEIDNAKLAADDFRVRWETELSMRQTVEGDIAGLRALQRDYDLANQAMMQDLQSLTEEYMALKKNHQQELLSVRGNLTGHINVNVQAAESANLSQVLADIRAEYEAVVEHNRRQAEGWYIRQVEMKQVESAQLAETEVSETHEVTDGRKHSLVLQMELEALLMGNENLKDRFAEVEAQYQQRLLGMSGLVAGLEGELSSVHQGVAQQGQEYQRLLDIKSRLEMEINTYKQLLEGAAVVGAGMVSLPRGEVTMMASGGREGASLIMKPRKISTSSTSSSAAAMMSSSGARGAAMMSTPEGGSTVIKTSKTVTIISSSGDTAGATDAAGASMPTSRGAATISTTGAKMAAEAAMMSSAEAAEMAVRGSVVEGGMMMKSSHTEFSSSVENMVVSGGETGAAGDLMKDGGAMMSSGDAMMSSEGVTMSGEAMVIDEVAVEMSSGGGSISVPSSSSEFSISSGAVLMSGEEVSSGGAMTSGGEIMSSGGVMMSSGDAAMSGGDMMVSGGEAGEASVSLQSSSSEFNSSSSGSDGTMRSGEGMMSLEGTMMSTGDAVIASGDMLSAGEESISEQSSSS